MNVVRKLIIRARRDNRKLDQATFTDFHKVKVIFVGEDAKTPQSVRVCLVVLRLSL